MIIPPPAASNPRIIRETRVATLEITPLALLAWDFRVEGPEPPATTLELTRFRDRGTFTLAGADYTMIREGVVRPTFRLERGGVTIARAEARGWLLQAYRVTAGERRVELKRRGFLPKYVVEQGRARLGEIRRRSVFKRAAVATFDDRIDRPTQIFLVFLALIEWRHQSRRRH